MVLLAVGLGVADAVGVLDSCVGVGEAELLDSSALDSSALGLAEAAELAEAVADGLAGAGADVVAGAFEVGVLMSGPERSRAHTTTMSSRTALARTMAAMAGAESRCCSSASSTWSCVVDSSAGGVKRTGSDFWVANAALCSASGSRNQSLGRSGIRCVGTLGAEAGGVVGVSTRVSSPGDTGSRRTREVVSLRSGAVSYTHLTLPTKA